MYKKILYIIFSLLLFAVFFPISLYADTRVSDASHGGNWTKQNSPYILEDNIHYSSEYGLHIGPGVVVMSASSTDDNEGPFTISNDGNLTIEGTEGEPVSIIGLGNIYSQDANVNISNTIFKNTGLNVLRSTTTLSRISINASLTAITAKQSRIDIKDSEIKDNTNGIVSNLWTPGPYLSSVADKDAIGGLGNAEDMDMKQNIITIHNSIIENNSGYSIRNKTANTIDASKNWWGNESGPSTTAVSGAVITNPWMKKDPREKDICCSNVLFLPGFEASRLYRNEKGLLGTSTNELWEPNRNDDVRNLYMDNTGKSMNQDIYTKDIMDKALGVKSIYHKFIAMMNGVVADKKINEWLPFAYDWRNNVSDIISIPTVYATSSKSLVYEAEKLASNSKTGKLSIVAHSNGGLVAKVLGKELERLGKGSIVDKVIFVATPHLGTPQAIAGMLHGDSQSILGGNVLSSSVARTFGLNMSGAYGLLPSKEFFKRMISPVLSFTSSSIDSYSKFIDFILGKSDNRMQPKESDLKTPSILSGLLLKNNESIHEDIDNWQFPTFTKVLSLTGWGLPTTETIDYRGNIPMKIQNPEGDGTVLSSSADSYDGDKIYINQGSLKHDKKGYFDHSNIMESDSINSVILTDIVSTSSIKNILPSYMSYEKPNADDYPWMKWITVSVHSPVDIDVYDSHGGHIGLVPLPSDPSSDIRHIDDTIGAEYYEFAGGKFITLPADDTYSVRLKGTGTGNFTFMIQKFAGGNMTEVASSTYAYLPVTPLLVASTSVNFLTIAPSLTLDVDGDGKTDIQTLPNNSIDPLIHLDSIKKIILSLHLGRFIENRFLDRVEHMRGLIKKGKNEKAIKYIKTMSERLENRHFNIKKLTNTDRKIIIDSINSLIEGLENGLTT